MSSGDSQARATVTQSDETIKSACRYLANLREERGWLGDETPFKHGSPFKHDSHPDPGNKIRLLQILPDSGTGLCCFLLEVHTKRPEGGGYHALSYEWGTTEEQVSIRLNHRSFNIRRNLRLFLLELRSYFADEVGRQLFFVDAICIDQNSLDEMNAQVRLMGKIFSEATGVHARLGPHADDSAAALARWQAAERHDEIRQSNEKLQMQSSRFQAMHLTNATIQSSQRMLSARGLEPDLYWKAISALTQRTYWSWLWILQEVLLAQNLSFWCGDIQLSGKTYTLFNLLDPAFHLIDLGPKRYNPAFAGSTGTSYQRLTERLRASDKSLANLTLQTLIEDFGDAMCSDLHDRVYGLMGMAQTPDESPPDIDYSKPLEVLFFEVLRVCKPSKRQKFSDCLMKALGLDSSYTIDLSRR